MATMECDPELRLVVGTNCHLSGWLLDGKLSTPPIGFAPSKTATVVPVDSGLPRTPPILGECSATPPLATFTFGLITVSMTASIVRDCGIADVGGNMTGAGDDAADPGDDAADAGAKGADTPGLGIDAGLLEVGAGGVGTVMDNEGVDAADDGAEGADAPGLGIDPGLLEAAAGAEDTGRGTEGPDIDTGSTPIGAAGAGPLPLSGVKAAGGFAPT